MKIPDRFKLFGHTIVTVSDPMLGPHHDLKGSYHKESHEIILDASERGNPPSNIEQTYIHEVVHAILDHLRYDDLHKDEKFVDSFAHALHQFLTTQEFK